MTKDDVVNHNRDLIAAAAKILKTLPNQSLELIPDTADPHQTFEIAFSNVDRVDLFVDDRPALSNEITDQKGHATAALPFAAPAGSFVIAHGYRKGELVVSTRILVSP